jgi:D-serine deaminase-like pyridoxal phosphate-dependent protein
VTTGGVFGVPQLEETPTVVVDLGRVVANIQRMQDELTTRGVLLRPHAKTHKSIQIGRLQLAAGATGLTTATLAEAEVFAAAGFDDLFVAYPVWAYGARADRLRRILRTSSLRVGCDSVEAAELLGAAARGADRPLEVLVEVDSGGARSGVGTPQAAVDVADAAAASGCVVVGVFTHGGHSYTSPTAPVGASDDEVRALAAAADALSASGHAVTVVSAGSTPTATRSARPPVTEERPGTFVFGDRQQVMLGTATPDTVALVVRSTVVSTAQPEHVVIDAGAKVLAKDRHPALDGHGWLPDYPHAVISRVYDHHAVVEPGDGPRPALGEQVSVIPNHVCPVVNLTRELLVLDGPDTHRWPVDTGRCNT